MTDQQIDMMISRAVSAGSSIPCPPCSQTETIAKLVILAGEQQKLLEKINLHLFGNGHEGTATTIAKLVDVTRDIKHMVWLVVGTVVPLAVAAFIYLVVIHPASIHIP